MGRAPAAAAATPPPPISATARGLRDWGGSGSCAPARGQSSCDGHCRARALCGLRASRSEARQAARHRCCHCVHRRPQPACSQTCVHLCPLTHARYAVFGPAMATLALAACLSVNPRHAPLAEDACSSAALQLLACELPGGPLLQRVSCASPGQLWRRRQVTVLRPPLRAVRVLCGRATLRVKPARARTPHAASRVASSTSDSPP